jgi:regulator of protease activity HflC (stomatin/prohibitin superfamily)
MKNQKTTSNLKRVLLFFAIGVSMLSGCAKIETGNVGIVKHWNHTIASNVAGPGLHSAIFDSYIDIDTTQTRVAVNDLQPKDAKGVSLKKVDLVVTYSLDPNKVVGFYKTTKEIDPEPNSLPDDDYKTLGLSILQTTIIPNSVQDATEQYHLIDIAKNINAYQSKIRSNIINNLNKQYGNNNPFIIDSVRINKFKLPHAIQQQIDKQASLVEELETLKKENTVIEASKKNQILSASISADAIAAAAKDSGLTAEQVLQLQKIQAIKALADSGKATVLVNTNTKSKP